jgi:hypothetical protein
VLLPTARPRLRPCLLNLIRETAVPLLCPYDSVFVSILQKTVFNLFKQSGHMSTPQYAPNAIVVLDVVVCQRPGQSFIIRCLQ